MRSFTKDYEQLEKIGQGTYGAVYKVRQLKTNELYALKKIRLDAQERSLPATALREIAILRALDHPNVLRLHRVAFRPERRKLYLFLELADTDLRSFLAARPLPFGLLCSFARQLLLGLEYLHGQRVMHRDVKTQNVLLKVTAGELKLGDFGLARPFTLPFGRLSPEIQSLWYRAPEVLLGETAYSPAVDMWSAGCVIAEMALRRPLFAANCEFAMLVSIFALLGTPATDSALSALPFFGRAFPRFARKDDALREIAAAPALAALLERALELDPQKRITAREALRLSLFTED